MLRCYGLFDAQCGVDAGYGHPATFMNEVHHFLAQFMVDCAEHHGSFSDEDFFKQQFALFIFHREGLCELNQLTCFIYSFAGKEADGQLL